MPEFYAVASNSEAAVTARKLAGVYVNSTEMTKKQDAAYEEIYKWFKTKSGKSARVHESRIIDKFGEVIHFGFAD